MVCRFPPQTCHVHVNSWVKPSGHNSRQQREIDVGSASRSRARHAFVNQHVQDRSSLFTLARQAATPDDSFSSQRLMLENPRANIWGPGQPVGIEGVGASSKCGKLDLCQRARTRALRYCHNLSTIFGVIFCCLNVETGFLKLSEACQLGSVGRGFVR